MKKLLLLISLSLCLGLSVHAKEDIQSLCKEQREKVDDMVKVISTIQDQSIKDYLYQNWVNPNLEDINKQADNNEKDVYLKFDVYYASGLAIAFKEIDKRIQAYKKEYDNLPGWKKTETVNPYEPFMVKEGEDWYFNHKNPRSFYFSLPAKPDPKYTIANLRQYLQEYVDCTQVTKEGETIKSTDRVEKFYDENKLYEYEPQELADLIIQVMLELDQVQYATNNRVGHFMDLWDCNGNLWSGLHKNITLQEATEQIKTAVYALTPIKYNDVMEALNLEFKQKGMSEIQAKNEAEKKLNSIIQIYANKLVEKARGGQNSLKK